MAFGQYIKAASIILCTIVIVGGVVVAIAFLAFGNQRDAMVTQKQTILAQIKENAAEENLVVMLHARIGSIDKIIASQVSYAPFIDTTMFLLQSVPLKSFSLGEKNSVSISVETQTLEEAINVMKTLLTMEENKKIAYPVLKSFTMEKNKIQLGLSFTIVM